MDFKVGLFGFAVSADLDTGQDIFWAGIIGVAMLWH